MSAHEVLFLLGLLICKAWICSILWLALRIGRDIDWSLPDS